MEGTIVGAADVVIVTAAEGEDDGVRAVRGGALTEWANRAGPGAFSVQSCVFESSSGHPLNIVLARAHEQRAEATATMATALLEEYRPRCLAMCGVCAGRPGWTELGDVIVADRIYRYDAGTRVDGRLARHDVATYNLDADWKQAAERLTVPSSAVWLSERPYTLAAQSQWLLAELRAGRDPETSPERDSRCHDWRDVLEDLWKRGALVRNTLTLTAKGTAEIDRVLLLHHGSLPNRPPFKIHVGPFGTGNNLVTDDAIWDEIVIQQSHVRGLDMEASAIGVVGHVWKVPNTIVVKGVMDFAERKRARYFRPFAARAAAEVLMAFLRDRLAAYVDEHATALGLSVSRDEHELQLWAFNRGTHVIRDIEVTAIPAAEDWFERTHGPLPKIEPGSESSNLVYPIVGGWFHATIPQLSPSRGYMIARGNLNSRDYTVMDFDVFWNDHEGRQRKSNGVADVRTADGDLTLKPRVRPV
jgi:nucleoside phosphorylase